MNKRTNLLPLMLLCCIMSAFGSTERPKLLVGIVVDQMRWDYLSRFRYNFSENGFKRLLANGFNCNNCLINYTPTVTAVGHAAIYTGSIPAINGIVSNDFIVDGKKVYCTYDPNVSTVGSDDRKAGQHSPHRNLVTTITDELRIATNFRSKVIGISLKDRASILPAGHCANAAYWVDAKNGRFITSTYYMKSLPSWVERFNREHSKNLLKKTEWKPLLKPESYLQSVGWDNGYDETTTPDFRYTPAGNSIITDFAIRAIDNEALGADSITDFLAISYSSTDMVGHITGPQSPRIEDIYLRLDREIERLLDALDKFVGNNNYTLFLTADHAAVQNVKWRMDHKLPASLWSRSSIISYIDSVAKNDFQIAKSVVLHVENFQPYLDRQAIEANGTDFRKFTDKVCQALQHRQDIAYAFPCTEIPTYIPEPIRTSVVNGYNSKRSGDIVIIPESGVTIPYRNIEGNLKGTNHSVWGPNDSHIPLIFYGKGIPKGKTSTRVSITDIAPTIANLLEIQQPSGCVGNVIQFTP